MKHRIPDYYTRFKCIAGKCRHSCCIGWEIDIDGDTYERYRNIPGEIGRRIIDNTAVNDGVASFVLGKDERCPFLNKDGLCDIILALGEEALCQICTEHPRFHNLRGDCYIESGVGLCCEAAADIIINNEETVRFVMLEDDGNVTLDADDLRLCEFRDSLIEFAQDRSLPMYKRIDRICEAIGAYLPELDFAEWADVFLSLERLYTTWDDILRDACCNEADHEIDDVKYEQLLVYFLYRHTGEALDDDELALRCLFALLCVQMVSETAARVELPLAEIARMFSCEVEYSTDNIATLLDLLEDEAVFD